MSNLPLPLFYKETLTSLLPVFDDSLSLSSSSAQTIIKSSLDSLYLIQRIINSLALFSGNELVSELAENELLFLSVGWVVGACEERGGLGSSRDRMEALDQAQNAYNAFVELLDTYQVVSPQLISNGNATGDQSSMAARRREAKIRQYKYERDLRERIASLLGNRAEPTSNTLTLILPLLQSSSKSLPNATSNEEEEHSRTIVLEVLRLLHTLASSSLTSIEQELAILSSAPSPPESHPSTSNRRNGGAENEDLSWRLDHTPALTKPSSLISSGGKVLRPFTILPNSTQASDRESLRDQVFSQGYRLPTMTIDEYLAGEQRRGNIITGGGQASYDAPTETELLELAAEDDGTLLGDDKAEQLRQKDEKWAIFTEANKKGAGNTMNKG